MVKMDNQGFRDLFSKDAHPENRTAARSSALGAKKSSFVPKTPRSGSGNTDNVDFARQVRERNAGLRPPKTFKASTPLGTKLGSGYTDRAKARADAEKQEEAEKTKRIGALKEQVRLGQLSQEDFEDIRVKIVNGDAGAPQVKGLDRTLLERTKRGEDVLDLTGVDTEKPSNDVDDELEKLGEQEIRSIKRDTTAKVGIRGSTQVIGVKRSRDEIMAELKAKRQALAREKAESAAVFDPSRWRKVGEQVKDKVIVDSKGREVLITVDEDGIVKRKVRKLPNADASKTTQKLDKSKPVLGADVTVPELPKPVENEESEEDDIFAGVGAEYNPLSEEDDGDDDSDVGSNMRSPQMSSRRASTGSAKSPSVISHEGVSQKSESGNRAPRNYFDDRHEPEEKPNSPLFQDVENIIKKAAQIGHLQSISEDSEEKTKREKHAKMMARDRDLDDMDMGFGNSRYDDEDDGEDGRKPRLSEWKQNEEGWERQSRASGKAKRKPKKRKGDVNNVNDIMRVIEGRRKDK